MSEDPRELTFDAIQVGDHASFDVVVTKELVDSFAKLSGDNNPLHMDDAYAAQTSFRERVAHGMIVGAFFSRLVGMHLPGKYALYLSQTLRFHTPVAVGTTLVIVGTVTHKTDAARTVAIRLSAEGPDKKLMVSGEALVQLLK